MGWKAAEPCVAVGGVASCLSACTDNKRDAGTPMAPFFHAVDGKQSPPQKWQDRTGQEDLAVALCILYGFRKGTVDLAAAELDWNA